MFYRDEADPIQKFVLWLQRESHNVHLCLSKIEILCTLVGCRHQLTYHTVKFGLRYCSVIEFVESLEFHTFHATCFGFPPKCCGKFYGCYVFNGVYLTRDLMDGMQSHGYCVGSNWSTNRS